jgi:hypothetical protein
MNAALPLNPGPHLAQTENHRALRCLGTPNGRLWNGIKVRSGRKPTYPNTRKALDATRPSSSQNGRPFLSLLIRESVTFA